MRIPNGPGLIDCRDLLTPLILQTQWVQAIPSPSPRLTPSMSSPGTFPDVDGGVGGAYKHERREYKPALVD